ncbi:hypothetical protein BDV93DRAFT_510731 [Ceratobasidium sp. AG-I]|nr:hypothetical protein BDV93DRAFT_510731 [Ceratobasidium sp. AG-I]
MGFEYKLIIPLLSTLTLFHFSIFWSNIWIIYLRLKQSWYYFMSNLPQYESPSLFTRVFRRSGPYQSQVEAAHLFVVENYQLGDHVILLGWLWEDFGGLRYAAIRQLATALDVGIITDASGSKLLAGRISINFPSTIENLLCMRSTDAYVVQHGSLAQITRKEVWLSTDDFWWGWQGWLRFQTGHIIKYNPSEVVDSSYPFRLVGEIGQPQLLSATTHPNCTRHCQGLPCDDAIPTGGQLTRLSKVAGRTLDLWTEGMSSYICVVLSYQSFAEAEYDAVCDAPLVGPHRL